MSRSPTSKIGQRDVQPCMFMYLCLRVIPRVFSIGPHFLHTRLSPSTLYPHTQPATLTPRLPPYHYSNL